MDIEALNQELSERIAGLQEEMNSLQTELNSCISQSEVLSIIRSLKSFVNTKQGYGDVINTRSFSRDAFYAFISLLNPSEYIRGFSDTKGYSDERPESSKHTQYFLTLGLGICLSINFCETERKEYRGSSMIYDLTVRAYVDSQDLCVETISEPVFPDHSVILIRKQDGGRVFDANAIDENFGFSGQKLNEVLTPVSPDDLVNRFLNMIKSPDEKGMRP
ncbi:MAG: hypothetical protein K2L98_00055 [Bacilli bacterium]|nr:hypothetical protein [Bacilli bacterium]